MVTGSIQSNKGKYYAVINLKDENGKRKPKWISTGLEVKDGNKRKAEKFLQEQLALWNGRNGIFIGTGLAEYLEHWLETIPRDIRPSTYRGYCGNMNNHIIPYFKQHPVALQDVTPMILEEYYYSLLKPESNLTTGTALSPTTIHHHHQNISKALHKKVLLYQIVLFSSTADGLTTVCRPFVAGRMPYFTTKFTFPNGHDVRKKK